MSSSVLEVVWSWVHRCSLKMRPTSPEPILTLKSELEDESRRDMLAKLQAPGIKTHRPLRALDPHVSALKGVHRSLAKKPEKTEAAGGHGRLFFFLIILSVCEQVRNSVLALMVRCVAHINLISCACPGDSVRARCAVLRSAQPLAAAWHLMCSAPFSNAGIHLARG